LNFKNKKNKKYSEFKDQFINFISVPLCLLGAFIGKQEDAEQFKQSSDKTTGKESSSLGVLLPYDRPEIHAIPEKIAGTHFWLNRMRPNRKTFLQFPKMMYMTNSCP